MREMEHCALCFDEIEGSVPQKSTGSSTSLRSAQNDRGLGFCVGNSILVNEKTQRGNSRWVFGYYLVYFSVIPCRGPSFPPRQERKQRMRPRGLLALPRETPRNQGAIAPGNRSIFIRCAEHHPLVPPGPSIACAVISSAIYERYLSQEISAFKGVQKQTAYLE